MKLRRSFNQAIGTASFLIRSSTFGVSEDRKQILLDIKKEITSRTLRSISIVFRSAGYHVLFRAHPRQSGRILWAARQLKGEDDVSFIWRAPASGGSLVVCTDDAGWDAARGKYRPKILHLARDYGPHLQLGPADFALPYLMHPQLYDQYHAHLKLDHYRQNARTVRILFAGNSNSSGYNNPIFHQVFHLQTRHQALTCIEEEGRAWPITNGEDLDGVLARGCEDRLVLIDTARFRINQEHWLELLSRAEFFLCLPGVIMPMCHNAVEAMAVGTIPFTNYSNWFMPHLTPGLNCLAFSTLAELRSGLEGIFRIEQDQIAAFRRHVVQYYSDNLCPEVFVKRIVQSPRELLRLHVLEEDEANLRRVMASSNAPL